MEFEVVLPKRRGRKRKRKDGEDDQKAKRVVVGTRSKVLLGRYVKKEFEGSGIFIGKIASYDAGLYRVDYEDGDCEDLESGEVKQFLVEECDMDDQFLLRREKLDDLVSKKYLKAEDVTPVNAVESVHASDKVETMTNGGTSEIDGSQGDCNADSSSDSFEYAQDCDLGIEVDAPHVPPPPDLPCSSGNIGVPEEYVSHLFSVYSFLRSFSIRLFLSPFGLDDFVGALNCCVPNTLMDAIHVALMRALRSHFEILSSDGSELASKCIRCIDWSLLDTLTWPAFLVQYLLIMRYAEGLEWRGFYVDALSKDYYTLSAGRKLVILQILCDDVLDSAELRAEVDMREESEVGLDFDGVALPATESGPRRVHPRYSKTSACNDGAMKIISDSHATKSSSNSCALGLKSTGVDVDEDGNGDECRLCGMDGTLLCCDGCPSAYHSRCIGLSKMMLPQGAWYCPECKIDKSGPKITRTSSLRGAEMFGVDLYEQVFLGTCDHLLVLKVSRSSEPSVRYYNQNDIHGLLKALNSSVEHVSMYMGICKGILTYWDMSEEVLSHSEFVGLDKNLQPKKKDGECCTPGALSVEDNQNYPEKIDCENIANGVTESTLEDMDLSCIPNRCKETAVNQSPLEKVEVFDQLGQQITGSGSRNCKPTAERKLETATSTGSVSLQPNPSELIQQSMGVRSSVMEYAQCNSGNSNPRGCINGLSVASIMSSKSKQADYRGASGCGNRFGGCLYMGSTFIMQGYLNHYIHGDFAASSAANLAILSTEENRVSESHTSSNHRKIMSANFSLQIKAFASAAKRFFWPHYEKKLVEVPRERCGWCLSCKAAGSSKRGCLLNSAASNAIKGAMKILAGLRPVKSEGCLAGIATYLMFMEESLRGLTVGPFVNSTFRKHWSKEVEQARSLNRIKMLLLKLEENIRMVAFSSDWVKLVDDISAESPGIQSAATVVGSTQRRGPGGKRGRKSSSTSEVTDDDGQDTSKDFVWWRGGILSKHLYQRGTLPLSVIKKAALEGGSRKISGIHYADGFEVPRRSRQFVWRAAVEMSTNASQLALQVRYLDLHVRWSDLVRPEQSHPEGKAQDSEASAFRNAFLVDRKTVENKISYAVTFENQKHLPSRVMKSILETEQTEDGQEKNWFWETRIPLYLIKEYEEKAEKVVLSSTSMCVNNSSKSRIRPLKASRKNIFLYLSRKKENLEKCCCASCQIDLLMGDAVKCSRCQGFCHERCIMSKSVRMNDDVELSGTCRECYLATSSIPTEKISESPTSPLCLQGQELRHELTVPKSGKQNGHKQPSASTVTLQQSSKKKRASSNGSSLATNKNKKLSLGLIWKKGNLEDGVDFRLKHLILKDNPDRNPLALECNLCQKPYDSSLMYIRCEACEKWYHADAVELTEDKIFDVVGFKCCRCRRIRSPVCPHMDPETRAALEAKRVQRTRNPKQAIQGGGDSNPETILEQVKNENSGSTSVLPVEEDVVNVLEEKPNLFSHPMVNQVKEQKPESDFEWNGATVSGAMPQKLPVRRNVKPDKETSTSENIPPPFESSPYVGNILDPTMDSTPHVEWDVSMDGFEGDLMFDYEGLNYEDMEFEPQTYFSFTELLAPEESGVQADVVVDQSGDVMGNWQEASAPQQQESNPDEYQMDINYDQQEPTFCVEDATVGPMPCGVCSRADPNPDLWCHVCGLSIHCFCSPWHEDSSLEGGWKCGNCREWR